MSTLAEHSSSKTEVLQVLFGPAWRELIAAIAWELLDRMDPSATAITIQKWFINVRVTWADIAHAVNILFGPHP